eukprot:CAMPEP_0170492126 /NCGR_PEP_ID=MMETSP0208-20121228/11721_1 /TAXON_ID=197538 /ORGANISM="Strombidium inclinatum, Strain S3" /LENGTH=175 /DNA_ID=CAMNT_0010767821 /DNA_START=111 /DNA_END=638 /DNA_ORIENTATION=+
MVLAGLLGFLVFLGIIIQGYNILVALITCVYPMLQSIKAIEKKDNEETNMWLSFWTVFGLFQTLEMFCCCILDFIPYYSIVRLVFFLFLMLPQTRGAQVLYKSVFQPFLKQHQKEIEEFVNKVSSQASEVGKDLAEQAKSVSSTENLVKAAAKVQEFKEKVESDPQEPTTSNQVL